MANAVWCSGRPTPTNCNDVVGALFEYLAGRLDPLSGDRARNRALREFLSRVRTWATPYLRWRFLQQCKHWTTRDVQDLAEDATQHLLVAVAEGKADALVNTDETAAAAWCKRVLENLFLSELRRRSRRMTPSPEPYAATCETAFQAREAVERLLLALRREVQTQPKNVRRRVALLDDFLTSVFSPLTVGCSQTNRRHQRQSRGRRVAQQAWVSLKGRDARLTELTEIASALGLDAGAQL